MIMRWYLYPNPPESVHIQDEYVVDGCRIRMGGDTIEVESDDKDLAQGIVGRIDELLHRHLPSAYRVVTQEEWSHAAISGGMPFLMPVGMQSGMREPVRKERVYRA